MSVRFFKILLCVFLAHLLGLSVIWVGFSAPLPRPRATFAYEGALPVKAPAEKVWKGKSPARFVVDHSGNSNSNDWIRLRNLSK